MASKPLRTAEAWYSDDVNVIILDPDGWERTSRDIRHVFQTALISYKEYARRRSASTVLIRRSIDEPFMLHGREIKKGSLWSEV